MFDDYFRTNSHKINLGGRSTSGSTNRTSYLHEAQQRCLARVAATVMLEKKKETKGDNCKQFPDDGCLSSTFMQFWYYVLFNAPTIMISRKFA
jgi:hypothetical protein